MSSPLDGNGVATADIAAPVIRFVIFVKYGPVHFVPQIPWEQRPEHCPCVNEETHPVCPACPATVAGDDMVRGVCQARRHGRAPQALVELVLVSREPCP